MLLPEKERNMIKMLGNRWHELPQAVQIGSQDLLPCGGGELGPVERSLSQLPSDGDLGGLRVGALPLDIPNTKPPDSPSPAAQQRVATEL